MIVLSHYQIAPLLKSARPSAAQISPDLNLTTVEVTVTDAGVMFPAGDVLTWDDARAIAETDNACFALEDGAIHKLQTFSETTRRHVTLYPTKGAPTMLLAGFPMHRIKNTDPHQDTLAKIKAAEPRGRVLDTSMGLGYTAIQAARRATHVITLELDPAVEEIASENPWSRELFSNPKIERRIIDSAEAVLEFEDGAFDVIIHDPPTLQLAGDLYGAVYYHELYRILSKRGRLFHYIGDLKSPFGSRVAKGAGERLLAVGFREVKRRSESFALVALK